MLEKGAHDVESEVFNWWRDVHWTAPFQQLLSAVERVSCLHPLAIVARKRLDIAFYPDILRAVRLSVKAMFVPGGSGDDVREECVLSVSRAWVLSTDATSSLQKPFSHGDARPVPSETDSGASAAALSENTVAPFLSVRTAFDLYLKVLALPRGSRVVCSALTIPNMVEILEEHGLVPLPVDLDPDTLAPEPGALELEVEKHGNADGVDDNNGGRVRAIYVAHVFGAQVDTGPIAEAAGRHGLLLWEDCAQVFTGLQGYLGHPGSDAVFWSFGVIKRATALGGGVVRVKDTDILLSMQREEAEYPPQSTATYLRRVFKCSMLLACTSPLLFGILVHLLGLLGIDHDKVVMKLSHGFPEKGMLKAIRHRPSVPLLQMLAWRIRRYTPEGVEMRLRNCNRMLRLLDRALPRQYARGANDRGLGTFEGVFSMNLPKSPGISVNDILPGIRAHRHTLWLFPVMVEGGSDRADAVVEALLREGFDATRAPTSLMPIDRCMADRKPSGLYGRASPDATSTVLPRCSAMMDSLIYLPLLNNIPDSEWDRLAFALARLLSWNASLSGKAANSPSSVDARGSISDERETGGGRGVLQSLVAFVLRLDVLALSTLVFLTVSPILVLVYLLS